MNNDDRNLIQRITNGLFAAQERLAQDDNGRAIHTSDPYPVDRMNARLEIGKDMIRQETGRSVVRDVIIQEYVDELSRNRFLSVSRTEESIIVQTRTDVEDGNFSNLSDLERFISRPREDDE